MVRYQELQRYEKSAELEPGDALVIYGSDNGHDALEKLSQQSESESQYSAHWHDNHD